MSVELVGDITIEDFEEFFGESWEDYVAPIKVIKDGLEANGHSAGRGQISSAYFNHVTLPESERGRPLRTHFPETERDPIAVRKFYGSEFYSRVLAYEFLQNGSRLSAMFSSAAERPYEGEPMQEGLVHACNTFGQQNLNVLDYGYGMAHALSMMIDIAPQASFVGCDIDCKARRFVYAMFIKYVRGVSIRFEHKDPIEEPYVSGYGPYHFVNCTDVLEHCHNPEEEIKRIADVMVDGGILNLGVFFNSCFGDDVTHLEETEVYQDIPLWFSKVYEAGFELFAKDPRGCEKLYRKVST